MGIPIVTDPSSTHQALHLFPLSSCPFTLSLFLTLLSSLLCRRRSYRPSTPSPLFRCRLSLTNSGVSRRHPTRVHETDVSCFITWTSQEHSKKIFYPTTITTATTTRYTWRNTIILLNISTMNVSEIESWVSHSRILYITYNFKMCPSLDLTFIVWNRLFLDLLLDR